MVSQAHIKSFDARTWWGVATDRHGNEHEFHGTCVLGFTSSAIRSLYQGRLCELVFNTSGRLHHVRVGEAMRHA